MTDGSFLKRLGRAVQRRRDALNISQEELADRAGCHRNYIGLVERGERNPTVLKLRDICAALRITLADLMNDLK
jgi:transcriptional regulator with XRE-family HTH domain